jgi:hypothetical protein
MEIDGVVNTGPADSIVVLADVVRFSDLGSVAFAGGELRFAARDVSFVAKERLNTKKTTIVSIIATVGVLALAELFTPTAGFFGRGRGTQPTPR